MRIACVGYEFGRSILPKAAPIRSSLAVSQGGRLLFPANEATFKHGE